MDSKDKKNQGEKEFSIQPIKEGVDPKFAAHKAHPGPAMMTENVPQEGTKEERRAKAAEMNK